MTRLIALLAACWLLAAASPFDLLKADLQYWRDSTWLDVSDAPVTDSVDGSVTFVSRSGWSYSWCLSVSIPVTMEGRSRTLVLVFPLSDSGVSDTVRFE